MSVILTVTDTEALSNGDPSMNGFHLDQEEEDDEENAREAELVVFENTTQGLGLKICGGCSVDGKQDNGIFIKRVLPGGLAEQQGGLEEGDLLLDVNGQSMEDITYDRALSILRQASASNHVELVITRDEEAREAFEDLMSRYAAGAQLGQDKVVPYPVKNTVTGEQVVKADKLEEFQSHMEGFYKQTVGLRSDLLLDQEMERNGLADKYLDHEGLPELCQEDFSHSHFSPASSCNSEVERHINPTSPQPMRHSPLIGSEPGGARSAKVKSLQSVLSHSFPNAVDSLHPSCCFPVSKLEMTLQSLGFVISVQKHIELMKIIPVNSQGLTTFEDFVCAVRQVFHDELHTRGSSQCSTPQLPSESPAPGSPSLLNSCSEDDNPLQQENELLRKQIASLKEEVKEQKRLCQKAEEQVLCLRKESQGAMEESRSLRTKLRLAEQSQEAARKMEQDYEQVVAMLENEISHLRLQLSKSDGINEHRRLAVAACQLKKAESGKKTSEVATNKLLAHLQHVQDVLSDESSQSRPRDSDKGDKKKKKQRALQSLMSEGHDVIRTVQTLIEQIPLPFGWEENYTADGVRYYINHLNQTTSWTHPSSNVEHQSITAATGSGGARPPPAVDMGKRSDNTAPV